MSGLSNSPRPIKGGIVLVDPSSGTVLRSIAMQYNPDSISRSYQVQGVGGEAGDRLDVVRLKGPPIETIKVEAELDVTDALEAARLSPSTAVALGLQPQIAALETLIYPDSGTIRSNQQLAQTGTLEITPAQTPIILFVWSRNRIIPVRITDLTVTEEAFDSNLNPIRAKVAMTMRTLSTTDFPSGHRGNSLYLAYQETKERFSTLVATAPLSELGVTSL
jgi:hypothetical protein